MTHHGLNSTHEAIRSEVPMLSYPFFGDQPTLALRCQEFGLALALTDKARGRVRPEQAVAALGRMLGERASFAERLSRARGWELRTIAGRPRRKL